MDHLQEAKGQLEAGCSFADDGNGIEADRRIAIASAHAQIAQTEALQRIGDLFDGTTDAPGLIGVTGSVTTQHV